MYFLGELMAPFDMGWPPGMEEVLTATVLYTANQQICSVCDHEEMLRIEEDDVRCQNCGAVLRTKHTEEEVKMFLDNLDSEEIWLTCSLKLFSISMKQPEMLKGYVKEMLKNIPHVDIEVYVNIVGALGCIAQEYPEVIEPHIDRFADLLDHENQILRANSIGALMYVGKKYPKKIVPFIDDFVRFTRENDTELKHLALGALAVAAGERPDLVSENISDLMKATYDDFKENRINALIALHAISEKEPGKLDPEQFVNMMYSEMHEHKGMATAILCNLAEPDLFSEDDLQRIKELSDSDDHMVGTNAECLLEILEN